MGGQGAAEAPSTDLKEAASPEGEAVARLGGHPTLMENEVRS